MTKKSKPQNILVGSSDEDIMLKSSAAATRKLFSIHTGGVMSLAPIACP
jgi:hypothetical protein